MSNQSTALSEFHQKLHHPQLMYASNLRPFVCRNSPFDCRLFIVGFNPGTALPFKPYWKHASGFNKDRFLANYRKLHRGRLNGARRAIETIANIVGQDVTLDTNVYSYPTKSIKEFDALGPEHDRKEIFDFLMGCLRPEVVLVHGKRSIEAFNDLYKTKLDRSCLAQQAVLRGRQLKLVGSPHLSKRGLDSKSIGHLLAQALFE